MRQQPRSIGDAAQLAGRNGPKAGRDRATAMDTTATRAPYACDPDQSRGRLHAEPASTSRSAFRRDCDRIIHSTAFRRLKHKTQVFVFDEGDHYRTRLTHTLEVTQVARALARRLRLDEDLAEALALAHDLGHPPFGHAGERALDECLAAFGGFDHNAQTLRIVTALGAPLSALRRLEPDLGNARRPGQAQRPAHRPRRRAARPLSRAAACRRRSSIMRSSRICSSGASPASRRRSPPLPTTSLTTPTTSTTGCAPGCFSSTRSPQCRCRARSSARSAPPIRGSTTTTWCTSWCGELIGLLIDDVVAETGRRLAALKPQSADDVRKAASPVAGFSAAMAEGDGAIKTFLKTQMYRHRAGDAGDGSGGRRRRATSLRATPRSPPTCRSEWQEGFPGSMKPRGRGASPISSPA